MSPFFIFEVLLEGVAKCFTPYFRKYGDWSNSKVVFRENALLLIVHFTVLSV